MASKGAKIASTVGNVAGDILMPEMAPITEQVITPENLDYIENLKHGALDYLAHSAGLTADEGGLGWIPLLGLTYWDVVLPLTTIAKEISGVLEQAYKALNGPLTAYQEGQQALDNARNSILYRGVLEGGDF